MTRKTPRARLSGSVRLGFLTSPPVKVTLFQASAENREPTTRRRPWPQSTSRGVRKHLGGRPIALGRLHAAEGVSGVDLHDFGIEGKNKPTTITIKRPAVLAMVKMF